MGSLSQSTSSAMIHHRRFAVLGTLAAPLAAFVLFAGCSPKPVRTTLRGERALVEASAQEVPGWVVREPESDREFHYFRGIRTDAPSLEAGETDARMNAVAGIIQFLGLRVTVDYQRLRTEEQTEIRDALQSVGGADIFGTRLSELFYRRWRIRDGEEVRDLYDVYVLVRFPRESVERIARSQQERLRNVEQLMAGPGLIGQPSEVYGQIVRTGQALTAINELNRSVLITTETEGQAENLKRQAVARLSRLIGGLRLSIATSAQQVTTGAQNAPFTISVTVTTEDRNASAPVPNVPVTMVFGDTSHTQVVWTDGNGVGQWEVREVPFGTGTRTITARAELPAAVEGISDIARSVPTASASVEVVPATQLVRLLVIVTERTDGQRLDRTLAEGWLVEALRKEGFTVVSPSQTPSDLGGLDPRANENAALVFAERVGATVLLTGTIETSQATPVEMMNGIYLTSAQARLTLTDLAASQVLATITLPDEVIRDTRGFGNTPERAADAALSLTRRGQRNGYEYIAEQVRVAVNH